MTDIRITDDGAFERLERELAERLEHGRFDEPRTLALEAALLAWRERRRDRLEAGYPPASATDDGGPGRPGRLHATLEDGMPAGDPPQQTAPERLGAPPGRRSAAGHGSRSAAAGGTPRTGTTGRKHRLRRILRAEVEDRLENDGGLILVDVAEPEAFAAGHLPGAVNLPLDGGFEAAARDLAPASDGPVVVYGPNARDGRSGEAAARLAASGFREVLDYAGGTADWRRAGLPLEAGG